MLLRGVGERGLLKDMNWSLTVHIIGIVLWLGGLLVGVRVCRMLASGDSVPSAAVTQALRKVWYVNVLQGMGLVLLSGLYQLFTGGIAFYFKQGWFHTKLTLVMLLFIATALFALELRKVAAGKGAQAKRLVFVQILTIVCLVGIVALSKALR